MKEFQKLAMPSRFPNSVITVSVIAYLFTLSQLGDTVADPRLLQEKLPFIFAWGATHLTIGWASATHAWNGLIATLDSALKPKRRKDDRTEHEERLESVLGLVWGTRLTALIASIIVVLTLGLTALNATLGGFQMNISDLSKQFFVLLVVSPGLFAFTSWAFLSGRVTDYYTKVRPAIDKGRPEEPLWDE